MTVYMMATKAFVDVGREEPALCVIRDEDPENFIGYWAGDSNFIKVRFPKSTARELTDEEENERRREDYHDPSSEDSRGDWDFLHVLIDLLDPEDATLDFLEKAEEALKEFA